MELELPKFSGDNAALVNKLNDMVAAIYRAINIRTDGIICQTTSANGTSLRLDIPALLAHIPKSQSGVALNLAYCKVAAGNSNAIVCYLNENIAVPPQNPLPTEITVYCFMFEASNLSDCVPLLTVGQMIPVCKIGEFWYCPWWFSGTEEC